MSYGPRRRPPLLRRWLLALPLLALAAAPGRACSINTANLLTITRPADGDGPLAGVVGVDITQATPPAGWEWLPPDPGPTVYVWDLTHAQHAGTSILYDFVEYAPHSGTGSYHWEFNATNPGPMYLPDQMQIEVQDTVWNPSTSESCTVDTTATITVNPPLQAQDASAQKLQCPIGRDPVRTQSVTSPLTGSQSWTVPITSWDYHGTTFAFGLSYNSLSLIDPQVTDPNSPTPDTPLVTDFAGLSEKNSKWSQPYAQWIDVYRDEHGVENAVWHSGAGYLAFPKSGSGFSSPDSYHTLASTPGTSQVSITCAGVGMVATAPYETFTLTDGAGTRYFFNQPQPGTGTHLTWTTSDCTAIPHYLLSRIQDRWGRGVNMTWSDETVGTGTQKRITAIKDDSGAGLTLTYANGLLQSVQDPEGRTHTLGYTAVPDETLPNPVNRMKLTSVTVQGPGSPNRTVRTWSFAYSSDPATNSAAYGGTYTGDLVIQKTEPDGTSASYQYEGVYLDPTDHTRPRPEDWDGRVSAISWPDSSEGGQSVTYTITRTLNSATQATLTYPSTPDLPLQVQYNYDTNGNLTAVTDLATGRVWNYTYDNMRNLLTVRSPLEQSGNPLVQYTPTLDANGHITQMVAQVRQDGGTLGDPVTTTYNLLNEPTQITATARAGSGNLDQVTQLHYDNDAPIMVPGSPGELTKILTAYGTALQQETDLTYGGTPGAWGLPDTVKNAVGATSSFGYDLTGGRLTSATSPPNLVTPSGDPAASVTMLQYNSDGLPSVVQDPMGHQESIAYTAQTPGSGNLLITITHMADSSARSLVLDPMGRIIQSTDENGVVTKWTYNPRGQVKTIERAVTKPEDRTTVFNYL